MSSHASIVSPRNRATVIGVAVLIFTNLVLLPILLSYTGVSPVAAQRSLKAELTEANDPQHRKHPFWAFLDLFTRMPWAGAAVALGVVFGAVGLAFSFQLKIGDTDLIIPAVAPPSLPAVNHNAVPTFTPTKSMRTEIKSQRRTNAYPDLPAMTDMAVPET